MLLLAFDTALPEPSAALFDGQELLACASPGTARGPSEALIPLLCETLDRARVGFDAVERLALCSGPGGFTGIRAGVAAARALSLVLQIDVQAVSFFEAGLAALRRHGITGPAWVVKAVRAGRVMRQRFDASGRPADPPELQDLEASLAEFGRSAAPIGTDCDALRSAATARGLAVHVTPAALAPDVGRAALAAGAAPLPGSMIVPFYALPPDARPAARAELPAAIGS